jgi:hypothetical protein
MRLFRFSHPIWTLLLVISLFFSCEKDEPTAASISLFGTTVNGINLVEGTINVQVAAEIEMIFSSTLSPAAFESAFSLSSATGPVSTTFRYTNATSKAVISVGNLDFNTLYTLKVAMTAIGANQEILDRSIAINFTTVDQGKITALAPCTSASDNCLQSVSLGDQANFDFYSSYPVTLENAEWENLEYAMIVIHGQNRDANNYFSYLTNTLNTTNLANSTILIAPFFKAESDANSGDLFWRNSNWRAGERSDNSTARSSFAVVDQIIAQLADQERFPVLKKIIITGHSSGGLWTQVYAAANRAETMYPNLDFDYIVANSQYFYYPDEVRYDEGSQQFVRPTACAGFDTWPLGFVNPTAYLNGTTEAVVNEQLISRKVTYLLGNGPQADPSLNTNNCSATLLGSSRFKRGENSFLLMETNYKDSNQHQKVIVNGIGHDGQAMYQSTEFKTLLQDLIK